MELFNLALAARWIVSFAACSKEREQKGGVRGFLCFWHLLYSLTPHESYFAEDFLWLPYLFAYKLSDFWQFGSFSQFSEFFLKRGVRLIAESLINFFL